MNAIYGPDQRDLSVADAAFRWNPDAPLSGFKIAYVRNGFEPQAGRGGEAGGRGAGGGGGRGGGRGGRGGLPPEERGRIYQSVIETYRKLGANLTAVDLPDLSIGDSIGFILTTEAAASFDDVTRSGEVDLLRTGTSRSTWPNTFKAGRFVPAVEYLRAQRARVLLMRQMDEFLAPYDALLSAGLDSTLGVTNLTGQPAIAVKCGVYTDIPVMLMLTGRLYEEASLCRIAMAYEQATEWKDRHPTL